MISKIRPIFFEYKGPLNYSVSIPKNITEMGIVYFPESNYICIMVSIEMDLGEFETGLFYFREEGEKINSVKFNNFLQDMGEILVDNKLIKIYYQKDIG